MSDAISAPAAAPSIEDILFREGQWWHHSISPFPQPSPLGEAMPTPAESAVVNDAERLLDQPNARAMALVNGDRVIWTGYKAPATPERLLFGFSIGKTVTSVAVGLAICDGLLSLSTPAATLLRELEGTPLGAATVRDLLVMSSGTWEGHMRDPRMGPQIFTPEQYRDIEANKTNWLQVLASAPVSAARIKNGLPVPAGSEFWYHGTCPLTLAAMLNRATGMSYAQWLEQRVFSAVRNAGRVRVVQDHAGYAQGDAGVRMTLSDWIRFAAWVKRSQRADTPFGEYVREATSPNTAVGDRRARGGVRGFETYGYLVWTGSEKAPGSYWAVGTGGQRIAWCAENDRMTLMFSAGEVSGVDALHAQWQALG